MSKEYPILGSPLQVNGVTMRNRMITTSMSPGEGYVTDDNRPTELLAAYLEERAAGGTGMIIQTICPWKRYEGDGIHALPSCYDETCIPDLKKYMIDPVHKHNGLICAQLYYVHDWKPDAETKEGPYGPSEIAVIPMMSGFRTMTLEQIEDFKAQFFNAAKVCKEAGFDAVEVMAGVGGILSRFMSSATNDRTDQYGGSLENRCRLTLEIIRGTREVVGPDYPIVVRWSPIDFIKTPQGEGLSMEESLQIAQWMESAGLDMHDLSVGWHETSVPLTTKGIEDGHWMYIAEQIKSVAKKPVGQGYRNTDPTVMEQNLQDGKCDVIAGLRYSIADPALPLKVMEDRTADMRKCIVCCRCIDDVVSRGLPLVYCGVNPHLGPELEHDMYPPAEKSKRVMVIGSGPAGINAAVTAAKRGHTVDLYEMGPRLGGCVKMSSIFSPYHERYLDYMKHLVETTPEVKVHLNTEVTPQLVQQVKPDAAIVAIGGAPINIDVPGAQGKNVITSHDFLEMINGHKPQGKKGLFNNFMWGAGAFFLKRYYTPSFARDMTAKMSWPIGREIAIIGGGLPGCELGHLCMETGRKTSIIEEKKKVGYDVSPSERFGLTSAFKKAPNVELYPLTRVTAVKESGVDCVQTDKEGNEKNIFVPGKTVAVTLGLDPNHGLGEKIKPLVDEVYLVGDCDNPARIADATKAGYVAACAL
ncbi:FAD-dependent oxidoreductase [Adlercreutzia murintestinalis]|uniref:oxidoreductase n=1 Tax=Adlercreutzia murintestinalis TaxID=2941325 RepID=UPI0020416592|nr:FAD-dependent oxidoreductase [Adlercreutzia murintestinalis]